jgi:hypothetical protein
MAISTIPKARLTIVNIIRYNRRFLFFVSIAEQDESTDFSFNPLSQFVWENMPIQVREFSNEI